MHCPFPEVRTFRAISSCFWEKKKKSVVSFQAQYAFSEQTGLRYSGNSIPWVLGITLRYAETGRRRGLDLLRSKPASFSQQPVTTGHTPYRECMYCKSSAPSVYVENSRG